MGREEAKLKGLVGLLEVKNKRIFPFHLKCEPRASVIKLSLLDEEGKPVPDAYVFWRCSLGKISELSSYKTDAEGRAFAVFYSEEPGMALVSCRISKQGYAPVELNESIEVVRNAIRLVVENRPPIGGIYLNGKKIGEGRAEAHIADTGIYLVEWEEVEGYVKPEPAKVYVNTSYSSLPIFLEGNYRPLGQRPDAIKLTVYVWITYDDFTGIPNPLPRAKVELSDGQAGYADETGKAAFWVKPNLGSLKVRAWHPEAWGVFHEIEVEVKDRDLNVNLDFGPYFGGEAGYDML